MHYVFTLDKYLNNTCYPCPMGTNSSFEASLDCYDCGYGYYSDSTGSTECTKCPSGYTTRTANSTSEMDCVITTTTNNEVRALGVESSRGSSSSGSGSRILMPSNTNIPISDHNYNIFTANYCIKVGDTLKPKKNTDSFSRKLLKKGKSNPSKKATKKSVNKTNASKSKKLKNSERKKKASKKKNPKDVKKKSTKSSKKKQNKIDADAYLCTDFVELISNSLREKCRYPFEFVSIRSCKDKTIQFNGYGFTPFQANRPLLEMTYLFLESCMDDFFVYQYKDVDHHDLLDNIGARHITIRTGDCNSGDLLISL